MRGISILCLLCGFGMVQAEMVKVNLLQRIHLVPAPQEVQESGAPFPFPSRIAIPAGSVQGEKSHKGLRQLVELLAAMPGVEVAIGGRADFTISLVHDSTVVHPEGYSLQMTESGAEIRSRTSAGSFYGLQTLYQIMAFGYYGTEFLYGWEEPDPADHGEGRCLPALIIRDYPRYAVRSLMLDLGRSVFSKTYLQRIIRIMAQLKLNTLHLHLYDDEIGGYRFETLPLGSENPFALCKPDLLELVAYAREYHVSILPEVESWGHVKSVIYHYPKLYGGPGMWGGASFAIGEKTFALLEKIYSEIADCLPDTAAIHVGLDEAKWAVTAGEEDKGYTPEKLVGIIAELVQKVGRARGKHLTVHMWADHDGRPIPDNVGQELVLQPWMYRRSDEDKITQSLAQYGGKGKRPLMLGAGITSACSRGDFAATRIWCQMGDPYPNVQGATICIWGTNNLSDRLISLYAGSDYLWSPLKPQPAEEDRYWEELRHRYERQMRNWQRIFTDATAEALDRDRGAEAFLGRWMTPPFAGMAVAPTLEYQPGVE